MSATAWSAHYAARSPALSPAVRFFPFGPPAAARRSGRWWRGPAERPVIADIDPDTARRRLALGQDRHRGVVAMQALGSKDMVLDQSMDGPQGGCARADLIGQRRCAEIDALAGIAFA